MFFYSCLGCIAHCCESIHGYFMTKTSTFACQINNYIYFVCFTFGASYPHDCLEADLAGEVALEVLLEALGLGGVVLVVVRGVVVDTSCGVARYAAWAREQNRKRQDRHNQVTMEERHKRDVSR